MAFAHGLELNHAEFYRQAANLVNHPRSKRLLVTLAHKEEEHAIVFLDIAADFADEACPQDHPSECPGDTMRKLNAMTQGRIFHQVANPADYITGNETTHELLEIAINAEKQTTEFYTLLGMTLADNEEKDKVERILDEEQSHIKFLCEVRGKIHS